MDHPPDPIVWTIGLIFAFGAILVAALRSIRARRQAPSLPGNPVVHYFERGDAQLGVPPGGYLAWWPERGRYAIYVERDGAPITVPTEGSMPRIVNGRGCLRLL